MTAGPLSDEDRSALLRVARAAMVARLAGRDRPGPPVSARLQEPGGAFVTLTAREDGSLRGCVGYVEGRFPLWETVCRAAESAAIDDSRFDPVTLGETGRIALEISVLGALRALEAELIEVGIHGLLVRRSGRSGLLLPQVAVEHGWDRLTFLDQTCRKAGLPKDAWRDPAAEVLGFTAEVFAEP